MDKLNSKHKNKSNHVMALMVGLVGLFAPIFLTGCEETETRVPLSENEAFYQMMALAENVGYNAKTMRKSGMSESEITDLLSEKIDLHNSWFSRLDNKYPRFEEEALAIVKDTEFFIEKVKKYRFSIFDYHAKRFVNDRSEYYPAGPCGGACGDLQLNAAISCHSGCTFSYSQCLNQGGGEPFCSNVLDGCGNDCCTATCPQ